MDRTRQKKQDGFTLIEIIAVLIILGILAAVAVPKYNDLTKDASNRAVEGALAAGVSQATMAYSQAVLQGQTTPIAWAVDEILKKNYATLNDYKYTYTAVGETGIKVTVTGGVDDTKGQTAFDNATLSEEQLSKTVDLATSSGS